MRNAYPPKRFEKIPKVALTILVECRRGMQNAGASSSPPVKTGWRRGSNPVWVELKKIEEKCLLENMNSCGL
jgi:hypothetical protein